MDPPRGMTGTLFASLLILLAFSRHANAFSNTRQQSGMLLQPASHVVKPSFVRTGIVSPTVLFQSTTSDDETTAKELQSPSEMKLREIQSELKEMGVSFTDCFDRDSLTKRLTDARNNGENVPKTVSKEHSTSTHKATSHHDATAETSPPPKEKTASSSSSKTSFDREAVLAELNSLRVPELRTRLSARKIRWANMLEKRDLVKALADAMEASCDFSPSGKLVPGEVADITDEDLTAELVAGASNTPLLLDVYATWCGPCQMVAPQLKLAAEELGDSVRVAKIDSDKYPDWSSKLRVGGLPTLLVFDGSTGEEVDRVEGALMKDGLVEFAKRHVS